MTDGGEGPGDGDDRDPKDGDSRGSSDGDDHESSDGDDHERTKTDVKLARARVVDGKADRLREWYAELERREAEVRETLAHEGVLTESAFLDERDGDTYLYVLMEADDLAAAQAAGDEEAFEIDEQHHAVLAECLTGGWQDLEPIAHLTNPALR
jgi:hypothetical protein